MTFSVQLGEDFEKRLEALSLETGRSRAYYVREAVAEYLDDLEDIYLAEARLADLKAGRGKTYTLAEVEAHLGLAV